jgi:hypothetical protein
MGGGWRRWLAACGCTSVASVGTGSTMCTGSGVRQRDRSSSTRCSVRMPALSTTFEPALLKRVKILVPRLRP